MCRKETARPTRSGRLFSAHEWITRSTGAAHSFSHLIESKVQIQHVDARLAQHTHLPSSGIFFDEPAKAIFTETACLCYARHLVVRRIRSDIRVQPRSRHSDQIDGNRLSCIRRTQLVDVALESLYKFRIGLGEVRSAGRIGRAHV